MRRQEGQSLIESVVVVAILGIIGAISAPSLGEFVRGRKAQAVASLLHTELNHARHAAVTRGFRTVICRSADGDSCAESGSWSQGLITFVDIDGNGSRDKSDPIIRVTQGHHFEGLRLALNDGRRRIVFRPDGRGGGTNATLLVCDSTGRPHRSVVVSVPGRVRMGRPSAGARCV